MKTKRKAIMLVLCAVMLVVVSVMGTLAYLTDKDTAVNTFTVGKVELTLDEAAVNEDGTVKEDADPARVKENKYHLIPGHTYVKDPKVTVKADSEDCYVRMFVEVENPDALTGPLAKDKLAEADKAIFWGADETFLLQALCGGWDSTVWNYVDCKEGTKTVGEGDDATPVDTLTYQFRYKEVVAKNEGPTKATELPALFETITLPGKYFGNTETAAVANVKINVTAQAIQADGFATADLAWAEWK